MTKPLLTALGFALCAPVALAQTPKPEVITHLNGLDIEISAMGVPTSTTAAGGELVGIRAVKVMNKTLLKIPFEIDRWTSIAKDRYPKGLPEPTSMDVTQWLFDSGRVGVTCTGGSGSKAYSVVASMEWP